MSDAMNDTLSAWMAGYERAWNSNADDDIRALFTPDAEYRTRPYRPPHRGHDAIIAFWLGEGEQSGTFAFTWHPVAVTPTTAVVQGRTTYRAAPTYDNLWVIEFAADGRASSFTEWWMELPAEPAASA